MKQKWVLPKWGNRKWVLKFSTAAIYKHCGCDALCTVSAEDQRERSAHEAWRHSDLSKWREYFYAVNNGPGKKYIHCNYFLQMDKISFCQVHREEPLVNPSSFWTPFSIVIMMEQDRRFGNVYLEKFTVCNLDERVLGLQSQSLCGKPGSAVYWLCGRGASFCFSDFRLCLWRAQCNGIKGSCPANSI